MTLHDISHDTPAGSGSNAPATSEQLARQQAIKQIERKRRFWISAAMSTLLMVILVFIWAMTEYRDLEFDLAAQPRVVPVLRTADRDAVGTRIARS